MKNINDFLNEIQSKVNSDTGGIKKDIEKGNINGLMGKLNQEQQDKVKELMKNPEQAKALLGSPQVQDIIKKLNLNFKKK